jgi:uncharacterized radical SAM superfamily protein
MEMPSAEAIWNLKEHDLNNLINSEELLRSPRKIRFYVPSFAYYNNSKLFGSNKEFPTISVTGKVCSLNCRHCEGKVLETMNPVETPEKLFSLVSKLKKEGASGCLISGGCLQDGSVPLEKFIPEIARIKKELGLTIFVHTGLLNSRTALTLKEAEVDAVLIDVLGSNETIEEIYNLNLITKDYESSLRALQDAELNFIPHIVTGLHNGKLKGEFEALKMIKSFNPSALVIISFMPIHGTAMASVKPPTPIDIARVLSTARVMFPQTPIVLGCMRPKGKHRKEIDLLSLKTGVDGIAFPDEHAREYAEKHGYQIYYSPFCCAQIYKDLLIQ